MLCNAFPAAFQEERTVFPADTDAILADAASTSNNNSSSLKGRWVDTWTAAPQAFKPPSEGGNDVVFPDATIRQTVPLTLGAGQIRLRFSNAFGTTDLPITKVTVALPQAERGRLLGSSSIDGQTLRTVTFGGNDSIIIPDSALAVSDPISFDPPIKAGQVLSVSMHLQDGQAGGTITSHIYSRTSTWMARGDQTASENCASSGIGPHWHFLSAVEAWTDISHKAMVVVGDSITDGRNSVLNENVKWPSLLFNRTQTTAGLEQISVVNQGQGGNQLLNNGIGPNAASRLDRDVLAHSGVGYVMIFEGINDIGHAPPTPTGQSAVEARLIQMYKQIISRAHTFGHAVFGGTITPFMCPPKPGRNKYALSPLREQTRLNVNEWIRTSGWFDAVVDFDKALANPANASELAPQFNTLDCLHPNDDGLRALADAFPLDVFGKFANGVESMT